MRIHFFTLVVLLVMVAGRIFSQEDADEYGNDPELQLIIAADKGDSLQVQQSLQKGVNVNAVTPEGVTSLMYAVQNGNIPMIRLLLKGGANPDLKPANGLTALISSVVGGQFEITEMLLRSGANINLTDNQGITPLMHAISVDSFYMADLLMYYDADVQLKDHQGVDALMLAAYLGKYETAVSLLELGADVNGKDNRDRSPLYFATAGNHPEIMELLILNGALLEAAAANDYTPLALATSLNYYEAARMLIGYGADVNSRVSGSLNPLTIALENHNDTLAKMLRNNDAVAVRWPFFNKFTTGLQGNFNARDVMLGVSMGFSDKKYNLWGAAGYGIRPNYIRVLEQQNDSNYYQYWEKRHMVYVQLDKGFFLPLRNPGLRLGAFAGAKEMLTFGGYRGSSGSPEIRLVLCPRIGAVLEYGFLRFKLNYEYMDLHLEDYSKHWCSFSLEFLFNRKRGNPNFTTIDWL